MKTCYHVARASHWFNGKGKYPSAFVSKPISFHSLGGAAHQAGTAIKTQTSFLTLPPPFGRATFLSCYRKGETEAQSKVATCPRLLRALQAVRGLQELLVHRQHLFAYSSFRKPRSVVVRMFLGVPT